MFRYAESESRSLHPFLVQWLNPSVPVLSELVRRCCRITTARLIFGHAGRCPVDSSGDPALNSSRTHAFSSRASVVGPPTRSPQQRERRPGRSGSCGRVGRGAPAVASSGSATRGADPVRRRVGRPTRRAPAV